jgi:DNA polymerase III subunit delta'
LALADVVGHERVREILSRAVAADRLPPALLLAGPEGVGKRTLALAVARAFLCERRDAPGCGACRVCRRIDRSLAQLPEWRAAALGRPKEPELMNHQLHPDLLLVEAGRTGETGDSLKREIKARQVQQLVEETMGRPFEARGRVFVVDSAHLMNPTAANRLLKSLEEPPRTTHFMLATAAPQALLPTIRSRCQTLRLGPLPVAQVEAWLVSRAGLAADDARLRAGLTGGSIGAALALDTEAWRQLRDDALGVIEQPDDALARQQAADRWAELAPDDLRLLLVALRGLLRDVAALAAGAQAGSALNADVADRVAGLARGPLGAEAGDLAERTAETLWALEGYASRALVLDGLLDAFAAVAES